MQEFSLKTKLNKWKVGKHNDDIFNTSNNTKKDAL